MSNNTVANNFITNSIITLDVHDVRLNGYFVDDQSVNEMITNSSPSPGLANHNVRGIIEEDSALANVHQSSSSIVMETEKVREQSDHQSNTMPKSMAKDNSSSDFFIHKKLKECCRCCLIQQRESQMKSIFDKDDCIVTMLVLLTNLQLSPGDGLPENICINCLKQLTQSINFKQQIEAANTALKNYVTKGCQQELDNGELNIRTLEITGELNKNGNEDMNTMEMLSKRQISKNDIEGEVNNEPTEILPEIVYMDEDIDNGNEKFNFNDDSMNEEIDMMSEEAKKEKKFGYEKENCENLEINHKDELTCEKCDKVYKDHTTYFRHIESHSKLYFCDYCKQSFRYRTAYKNHLKCHTESSSLSNATNKNWNDCNLNGKLKCEICDIVFNFEIDLFVHGSLHDSDEKFICRKCKKEFSAFIKLKRHIPTHYEDKPYKCEICGMGFPENASLTRHFRKHDVDLNREKKYSCKMCDKKYYDSHSLMIHTRLHTGEKPWKCKLCDKAFIDSRLLNSHMKTHSNEKTYKCDTCSKGFTHASTLKTHIRVHTGEKPYVCGVCDKTFIQASNLNLHMRIHTGEKPYSCTICSMSFASSSTLTSHMHKHYNENEKSYYYCPICNKNLSRGHLKIHMRIHLSEKPYECGNCLRKFRTSSQLNQHKKKTHSLQNESVLCEICNENFKNSKALENHKNIKHKNNNDQNYEVSDNVKKLKNKIKQIKEQELIEENEFSSTLPNLNDDKIDKNLESDDSNYNENTILVNNLLSAVTGCTSMEDSYDLDDRQHHFDRNAEEQQ